MAGTTANEFNVVAGGMSAQIIMLNKELGKLVNTMTETFIPQLKEFVVAFREALQDDGRTGKLTRGLTVLAGVLVVLGPGLLAVVLGLEAIYKVGRDAFSLLNVQTMATTAKVMLLAAALWSAYKAAQWLSGNEVTSLAEDTKRITESLYDGVVGALKDKAPELAATLEAGENTALKARDGAFDERIAELAASVEAAQDAHSKHSFQLIDALASLEQAIAKADRDGDDAKLAELRKKKFMLEAGIGIEGTRPSGLRMPNIRLGASDDTPVPVEIRERARSAYIGPRGDQHPVLKERASSDPLAARNAAIKQWAELQAMNRALRRVTSEIKHYESMLRIQQDALQTNKSMLSEWENSTTQVSEGTRGVVQGEIDRLANEIAKLNGMLSGAVSERDSLQAKIGDAQKNEVDVTGKVDAHVTGQANVDVTSHVNVRVDPSPDFITKVTRQATQAARAAVPLNTGKTMPDVAK